MPTTGLSDGGLKISYRLAVLDLEARSRDREASAIF